MLAFQSVHPGAARLGSRRPRTTPVPSAQTRPIEIRARPRPLNSASKKRPQAWFAGRHGSSNPARVPQRLSAACDGAVAPPSESVHGVFSPPLLSSGHRTYGIGEGSGGIPAWCYEQRYLRGGLHEADKTAGLKHARAALEAGADHATTLATAGFVIG